jgi:replicative DNA helicase
MVEPLRPHAEYAEEGVVGSILLNNEMLAEVTAMIGAEDFYSAKYRAIFEAEVRQGQGIDYVTLVEELRSAGKLELAGGESGVGRICELAFFPWHAPYYARIVADKAVRRRQLDFAASLTRRIYDNEDESIEDLNAWVLGRQQEIQLKGAGSGPVPIREVASAFYDKVEYWSKNPLDSGEMRGLGSGLEEMDALLLGMQPGELILLAARPSMGKSALGFEMARRVAKAKGRVLIVSMEMSQDQVMGRWAEAMSGVPTEVVERGACLEKHAGKKTEAAYPSSEELARYLTAVAEIAEYPYLEIYDQGALTTARIRTAALSQRARMGGLDLLVVDHTSLIAPPRGGGYETAAKREGQKSRELKALAKEVGVPVILMQQLNRGLELRSDRRPQLSDLRDSGEHEENADVVLGLYWDGYYKKEKRPTDERLEVWCLKHRRGPAQVYRSLRYERGLSRFTGWE